VAKASVDDNLLVNGVAARFLGDVDDDWQVIGQPSEGVAQLPYGPGLNGVFEVHCQILSPGTDGKAMTIALVLAVGGFSLDGSGGDAVLGLLVGALKVVRQVILTDAPHTPFILARFGL
jgi:hypothetical protein